MVIGGTEVEAGEQQTIVKGSHNSGALSEKPEMVGALGKSNRK